MIKQLTLPVIVGLVLAGALPLSAQEGPVTEPGAKQAKREAKSAERDAERAKRDAEKARERANEAQEDAREARKELQETAEEQRREIREAQERGDKEEIREAREEAREELREKREDIREEQRKAREARGELSEKEREARQAEGLAARKRQEARKARADEKRADQWKDLSKRAGKPDAQPSDMPPPVRNELRSHARRSAKLDRIEAIAKEKDNDKLVDQVKELRRRENERHEARLEKLIENWKGKP